MNKNVVIENRKARHDFFLFDKYECGIELKGSEVKSIREGRMNLKDSYVRVINGEVFAVNLHIASYSHDAHIFSPDPLRTRRLLLKKREIEKLTAQTGQKGFLCVPLRAYFKRNFVKLEIALAKKKKEYDKRQALRTRIQDREVREAIKKNLRK